MKKVFQNIVDKDIGNCQQAAIASLLEKELDEVPNFLQNFHNGLTNYTSNSILYFWHLGYEVTCFTRYNDSRWKEKLTFEEIVKIDGGLEGYFYASVPSQTFKGVSHAVIVDSDLKVVHDPNPNQLALTLKPKDVQYVYAMNHWYISKEGELVKTDEYVEEGIKLIVE